MDSNVRAGSIPASSTRLREISEAENMSIKVKVNFYISVTLIKLYG